MAKREGLPILYDSDIAYFDDESCVAYTKDGEEYAYNEFIYIQGSREDARESEK